MRRTWGHSTEKAFILSPYRNPAKPSLKTASERERPFSPRTFSPSVSISSTRSSSGSCRKSRPVGEKYGPPSKGPLPPPPEGRRAAELAMPPSEVWDWWREP